MNAQPPSKPDDMPLGKKLEMMQWAARFPALTVMVFLRRDMGYRMVNPLWLLGVAAVLIAATGITLPENRPDDLLIFALLGLTLGLRQRYLRWRGIGMGLRLHSFSPGNSIFDLPSLPEFLRRNRRVARFVDPIVCAVVGLILYQVSPALGAWLVFAALCLRAFEHAMNLREFERRLDTVDGLVASEIQAETVELFSPPSEPNGYPQGNSQTIPTGIGGDIHRRIHERKSRPGSSPP